MKTEIDDQLQSYLKDVPTKAKGIIRRYGNRIKQIDAEHKQSLNPFKKTEIKRERTRKVTKLTNSLCRLLPHLQDLSIKIERLTIMDLSQFERKLSNVFRCHADVLPIYQNTQKYLQQLKVVINSGVESLGDYRGIEDIDRLVSSWQATSESLAHLESLLIVLEKQSGYSAELSAKIDSSLAKLKGMMKSSEEDYLKPEEAKNILDELSVIVAKVTAEVDVNQGDHFILQDLEEWWAFIQARQVANQDQLNIWQDRIVILKKITDETALAELVSELKNFVLSCDKKWENKYQELLTQLQNFEFEEVRRVMKDRNQCLLSFNQGEGSLKQCTQQLFEVNDRAVQKSRQILTLRAADIETEISKKLASCETMLKNVKATFRTDHDNETKKATVDNNILLLRARLHDIDLGSPQVVDCLTELSEIEASIKILNKTSNEERREIELSKSAIEENSIYVDELARLFDLALPSSHTEIKGKFCEVDSSVTKQAALRTLNNAMALIAERFANASDLITEKGNALIDELISLEAFIKPEVGKKTALINEFHALAKKNLSSLNPIEFRSYLGELSQCLLVLMDLLPELRKKFQETAVNLVNQAKQSVQEYEVLREYVAQNYSDSAAINEGFDSLSKSIVGIESIDTDFADNRKLVTELNMLLDKACEPLGELFNLRFEIQELQSQLSNKVADFPYRLGKFQHIFLEIEALILGPNLAETIPSDWALLKGQLHTAQKIFSKLNFVILRSERSVMNAMYKTLKTYVDGNSGSVNDSSKTGLYTRANQLVTVVEQLSGDVPDRKEMNEIERIVRSISQGVSL